MEPKKISFGFMKTKKVDKPVLTEKKQYIDCLEEKSIKVVGGETVVVKEELVIPMKPNTLMTAERLQQIAQEVEGAILDPEPTDKPPQDVVLVPKENETLDQMAERELLQDAKKEVEVQKLTLTVPLAQPPLEGQKESTLDDYESVPIADFGMAMLRGMGWTPNSDKSKYKQPVLRPKGLGLGADALIKKKAAKSNSKEEEKELMIIKGGFVKITSGKYSGLYGKIISLDEDNGRVLVDITMKKDTVSLSEFMMEPVTKNEYDQQSRVINSDKYEKYKDSERNPVKTEKAHANSKIRDFSPKSRLDNDRSYSRSEREKEPSRFDKNGREKSKKEYKNHENRRNNNDEDRKRYSSNDSVSSDYRYSKGKRNEIYESSDSISSISDSDLRPKHRDRRKSSSSSEDSYDKRSKKLKKVKRDIDKKRKGKKKKRDRDRSPNYRKYKK